MNIFQTLLKNKGEERKTNNMLRMLVIASLSSVVDCVTVGEIQNYVMVGAINRSLFNLTKDQCIRTMMRSLQLVFALNYFSENQTCQLFVYNNSSVLIESKLNTTFIFTDRSSISITTRQSVGKFINEEANWSNSRNPHKRINSRFI
jgi:hypothetical protein